MSASFTQHLASETQAKISSTSMNGESNINIYTLSCVKQIAGEKYTTQGVQYGVLMT